MKRSPLVHERIFDDEEHAEGYARQHQGMGERFGKEYAKKLAARGFSEGKIIDVGCGSGAMNLVLAERLPGSELVGIDLSEPLLRLASQAAEAADLNERVRFEKADVQQIPYPDDTFDVAINVNMVHLVEDPIGMLDEMERVLAPDGMLLIADLRRSWLGMLENEIKSAFALGEAGELLGRSRLRQGAFSWGFLWWRFEA